MSRHGRRRPARAQVRRRGRRGRGGRHPRLRASHDVVVVHGAGPQISRRDGRARARGAVRGRKALHDGRGARDRPRVARRGQRSRSARLSGRARSVSWATRSASKHDRSPSSASSVIPLPSRPALVLSALRQGRIPVVAPLAKGPLNVNADEAAVALAAGLEAERILFVTDVPGLLVDGDVVSSIGADEADRLLDDGTFQGGIVPKLQAAVRAATARHARRDRRDGGDPRDEPSPSTHGSCRPTRAQDVTFVRGRGRLARGRRRQAVPRLPGRDRRRRARPLPPGGDGRRPTPSSTASGTPRTSSGRSRCSSSPSGSPRRFGGAQAFFCNSGAEAIEAGLKYARKASGKPGIVALENSFHGRTLGALSVTGQPAKRAGFEPLVPDVRFARLNDAESLAAACADGERRLHPRSSRSRARAGSTRRPRRSSRRRPSSRRRHGGLLFFDEVQCGLGRTGTFFAHEQLGVRPERVALAKGLANGLPIGALLVADERRGRLRARRPRLDVRRQPGRVRRRPAPWSTRSTTQLLEHVAVDRREARRRAPIACPRVTEVRGAGLLHRRASSTGPPRPVVAACLEAGPGGRVGGRAVLRLTPPLVVSEDEVDLALADPRRGARAVTQARGSVRARSCGSCASEPISTQTELAEALHDAGLRRRPDDRLARHRRARASSRSARPSGRLVYAPPGTANGDRFRELVLALRRWALSVRVERKPGRRPHAVRLRERRWPESSTRRATRT